jgi:NADH:ubiquinone oxidoreductase subunit 3 (subunit A)
MLNTYGNLGNLLLQGGDKNSYISKLWIIQIIIAFIGAVAFIIIGSLEFIEQGQPTLFDSGRTSIRAELPMLFYGTIILIVVLDLVPVIIKTVVVVKTKINLFERGIAGRGANWWGASTSEFMIPYNQVSISIKGHVITIATPSGKYYVYASNAVDIQNAIFQMKNHISQHNPIMPNM